VIRRSGSGREVAWSIWGDESEVVERLEGGGATVREVEPLTLEEAAVALMAYKGGDLRLAGAGSAGQGS
jgi:ABC-2 type transport system ATP-binding protein